MNMRAEELAAAQWAPEARITVPVMARIVGKASDEVGLALLPARVEIAGLETLRALLRLELASDLLGGLAIASAFLLLLRLRPRPRLLVLLLRRGSDFGDLLDVDEDFAIEAMVG